MTEICEEIDRYEGKIKASSIGLSRQQITKALVLIVAGRYQKSVQKLMGTKGVPKQLTITQIGTMIGRLSDTYLVQMINAHSDEDSQESILKWLEIGYMMEPGYALKQPPIFSKYLYKMRLLEKFNDGEIDLDELHQMVKIYVYRYFSTSDAEKILYVVKREFVI